MDKKETIMAVGVLVFALALIVGVFMLSPSPKTSQKDSGNVMAEMSDADRANMQKAQSESSNAVPVIDLTSKSEVQIDIKDFKYDKPNIKIKKGTKVTWTNRDMVKHNVMAEHEGADQAHDPPTKDQVDPNEFAGPLLEKDESYSFTFNEVSAQPYHCSPHPFMKGSVTVVE